MSGAVPDPPEPGGLETVRADIWLWAVRLYKSRNLAAGACRKGQVRILGQPIKPARDLRVGDELAVERGFLTARYRVSGLLEERVGAKLVPSFLEDLTTDEEREKARQLAAQNPLPAQTGGKARPTKKDRRQIEELAEMEAQPLSPEEIEAMWKKAIR